MTPRSVAWLLLGLLVGLPLALVATRWPLFGVGCASYVGADLVRTVRLALAGERP